MTGDIRQKLLGSDAASSLEMEFRIAGLYEKQLWPSKQSAYFVDQNTKIREIDVLTSRTFLHGTRWRELIVNFGIISECKTLTNQHLIFTEERPSPHKLEQHINSRIHPMWIGYEWIWESLFETYI
jgi:hypothetical protein